MICIKSIGNFKEGETYLMEGNFANFSLAGEKYVPGETLLFYNYYLVDNPTKHLLTSDYFKHKKRDDTSTST